MRFDVAHDIRLVMINADAAVNLYDISAIYRYSGGSHIVLRGGGIVFVHMSPDEVMHKLGTYSGVTVKHG